MPYRYETTQNDYSDYASGRVFYNAPGQPVLPIRLTRELFQRAYALLDPAKRESRLTLYDPCCGSAYHLATLAYHHWPQIGRVLASDIDPELVTLAQRNLGLLQPHHLEARRAEIITLFQKFGKPSHQEALQSVERLTAQLASHRAKHAITTETFQADATDPVTLNESVGAEMIDLVCADLPYGRGTQWQGDAADNIDAGPPVVQLLEALSPVLQNHTIVAIVSDKGQKIAHPAFRRVERFQIGKRRIAFLKKH